MALPAYYWPPSGGVALASALVPYGPSGMAVADWSVASIWPFASGAFQAAISLSADRPGLASIISDNAAGLWALETGGNVWRVTSGGAVAPALTLPSGAIYDGAAMAGGNPWFSNTSGAVYSSGGVQIGTFGQQSAGLVASGTTLATILQSGAVIGTMAVPGGVTGSVVFPTQITSGSCLALAPSNDLVLAGWRNAPLLSGTAALALHPSGLYTLGAGSGNAILWGAQAIYSNAWPQAQAVTGLPSLTAVAWSPSGTQALATSLASGLVEIFNFSASGVLSVSGSLAVSGADGVAVTPNSAYAIVSQPGLSQVSILSNMAGVWAASAVVSGLAGVTSAVLAIDTTDMLVGTVSGLSQIGLVCGAWSHVSDIAIGFAPLYITQDLFGTIYAVANQKLAVVSGTTLLGSGSWTGGNPTGVTVNQGRVCIPTPTDNAIRIFAQSDVGVWSQQGSGVVGTGVTTAALVAGSTLFVATSGYTTLYSFSGTPFAIQKVQEGFVGFYAGGIWTMFDFGVEHLPCAATYNPTSNLWIATSQNDLMCLGQDASIVVSGNVTQYRPQAQNVPIGPAAILVFGNYVYIATSLPGVLVQEAVDVHGVSHIAGFAYPIAHMSGIFQQV